MDENCKRQKEVERTYGGLLPAVEGHSLGTRYKVHSAQFLTKGELLYLKVLEAFLKMFLGVY